MRGHMDTAFTTESDVSSNININSSVVSMRVPIHSPTLATRDKDHAVCRSPMHFHYSQHVARVLEW